MKNPAKLPDTFLFLYNEVPNVSKYEIKYDYTITESSSTL